MKAMFDSIEKGSKAGLAEQFELFFFKEFKVTGV